MPRWPSRWPGEFFRCPVRPPVARVRSVSDSRLRPAFECARPGCVAGSIAAGEVVSIFGTGIGPDSGVTGTLDASGVLPWILAGVEVQFNGADAPIFYAQSGQINAQVPYGVAGVI